MLVLPQDQAAACLDCPATMPCISISKLSAMARSVLWKSLPASHQNTFGFCNKTGCHSAMMTKKPRYPISVADNQRRMLQGIQRRKKRSDLSTGLKGGLIYVRHMWVRLESAVTASTAKPYDLSCKTYAVKNGPNQPCEHMRFCLPAKHIENLGEVGG